VTRPLSIRLPLACLAAIALALLALAPEPLNGQASNANVSGEWIGSFDASSPDGKTQHDTAFFILKQSETDLVGSAGATEHQQSEIKSGKVDGPRVQFTIETGNGTEFLFHLTLDGDHLIGSVTGHGRDREINAIVDVARIATQTLPSNDATDGLSKEIADMDNRLFQAFNERDLNTMASIFDKDLEFYHDREGLTNYQHNIDTFRRHFGEDTRVRRELVKGTMQVYPLTGYGAVEFCIQRFYTIEKGKAEHLSATSRLVGIWRNEGGKWTLARVISYDHR
jgi:hypothetical protein